MRKHAKLMVLVLSVCVFALLGYLMAPTIIPSVSYLIQKGQIKAYAQDLEQSSGALGELSRSFNSVAKIIAPSVVSIKSVVTVRMVNPFGGSPFEDSPFRDFFDNDEQFRRFFGDGSGPREYEQQRQGLGSGVIVRGDGYILTNNHVVANAEKLTVVLSDGRELTAEVIGTDPKSDLAVIKVEADNLVAARLGNSDKLEVGDWVVASGTPFGLSQTVTTGIISATGRSGIGITDYEDFIQTDAAINPGNSGGPLVNLKGEVIGINTAIFTRSGGYMGIGFAIPSNMAKSVMDSLIEKGKVVRGYLGVYIQDLTQDLANSFGYDSTNGALVSQVQKDSPAAKAGMQGGDIVTQYDGVDIKNVTQLRNNVAKTEVGDTVDIVVFRKGQETTLTVTIGELSQAEVAETAVPEKTTQQLGITVQNLTPDIADQLGYKGLQGVIVTKVDSQGMAAQVGIRSGDLIMEVQGQPVKNTDEFYQAMSKASLQEGIRLLVRSGNASHYVYLKG